MIHETLSKLITQLKAPKNLKNSFGNYSYRNAESIYEAIKPLLEKHKLSLVISDSIEAVGDRIYIKATATLTDSKGESVSATAYAREAFTKKGMDEAQITGSASSYARKYALGGLFLLDDSKDIDSLDNADTHASTPAPAKPKTARDHAQAVTQALLGAGLNMQDIKEFMQASGYKSTDTETMAKLASDTSTLIAEAQSFMQTMAQNGFTRS